MPISPLLNLGLVSVVRSLFDGLPHLFPPRSSVLFLFFCILFLSEFDLPTYSITPSAHPIKVPLSARHPVTLSPHPPPLPLPLVHFPELGQTLYGFIHTGNIRNSERA